MLTEETKKIITEELGQEKASTVYSVLVELMGLQGNDNIDSFITLNNDTISIKGDGGKEIYKFNDDDSIEYTGIPDGVEDETQYEHAHFNSFAEYIEAYKQAIRQQMGDSSDAYINQLDRLVTAVNERAMAELTFDDLDESLNESFDGYVYVLVTEDKGDEEDHSIKGIYRSFNTAKLKYKEIIRQYNSWWEDSIYDNSNSEEREEYFNILDNDAELFKRGAYTLLGDEDDYYYIEVINGQKDDSTITEWHWYNFYDDYIYSGIGLLKMKIEDFEEAEISELSFEDIEESLHEGLIAKNTTRSYREYQEDGYKILYSYQTPVCVIKDPGTSDSDVFLLENSNGSWGWHSSSTTIHHLSHFLNKYGFRYYTPGMTKMAQHYNIIDCNGYFDYNEHIEEPFSMSELSFDEE